MSDCFTRQRKTIDIYEQCKNPYDYIINNLLPKQQVGNCRFGIILQRLFQSWFIRNWGTETVLDAYSVNSLISSYLVKICTCLEMQWRWPFKILLSKIAERVSLLSTWNVESKIKAQLAWDMHDNVMLNNLVWCVPFVMLATDTKKRYGDYSVNSNNNIMEAYMKVLGVQRCDVSEYHDTST